MKKISLCLFILATLASCNNKIEVVENKDDNGNLIEKYSRRITDFAKEGLYTRYDSEGRKMEEAHYANDTLHGQRTIYFVSGKVEAIENYLNGAFSGVYQTFYEENEKLELTGEYINGTMQGSWKRYYPSGQLMEDVTFAGNEENGAFIEYYDNGNLKAKGTYLNGDNEHGLLEVYDEDGSLNRKMNCDNGICKTFWKKEE